MKSEEMKSRSEILSSTRTLVLKVGSTVLASPQAGVNMRVLGVIARQVAWLRARGIRVVIVSSGAIAAGRMKLDFGKKPLTLAMKQAAASVGQSRLMWGYERAFSPHRLMVSQVLLTPRDVVRRSRFTNLERTLETLLALGVVPVVNENDSVATEEIRFGDNDRLSALVSGTVKADFLLILSDVDGLYTSDPSRNPNAIPIPYVEKVTSDIESLAGISRSGLGTGGMASKVLTARWANRWGLPVGIVNGRKGAPVERFFEGGGTLFFARKKLWAAKKVWIGFFSEPSGTLVLDEGAMKAISHGKSSLLAGGITRHEGVFESGEVVRLLSATGHEIGRGVCRMPSSEVALWTRRKSSGERSADSWPLAVHRNTMVLWEREEE
ncbi:glutamate 5-kinase [Leptospirillum ferriphilum]|jgi:glutamate 5-kinase|uniref:Glutamate 5-kinase n=4 Tax=Leptospirillum ferriphilum TaxID=178606 RepID=A0A059XMX7_9BACT|nr:glutamate 5-kinase [Leptospirillum ferriphilum ML-04]AIA29884.1 glutamate 5-kinase [Leptospirillum ferriphilum YSK]OOH71939.1 glutamate 5-kinase [Leptospirillum ferriphilum]OOH79639.1 glutamate 5-kinase [Leptospirillum ferriphilum]